MRRCKVAIRHAQRQALHLRDVLFGREDDISEEKPKEEDDNVEEKRGTSGGDGGRGGQKGAWKRR